MPPSVRLFILALAFSPSRLLKLEKFLLVLYKAFGGLLLFMIKWLFDILVSLTYLNVL